ncbi:sulfotransferase domain-containing protein [Acidobacteria bacterium AH-259-A15]|nr:sulfotransferase domain-containing protein [Acidobacteria bacterium AH-259-A15]
MNRYLFFGRNLSDKLIKAIRNCSTLKFYWQTYILSRFESVEPDVYIVSYPKCGRTWLRVMFQKYGEQLGCSSQRFNDRFVLRMLDNQIIKFDHDQGTWVPAPPKIEQLSFDVPKYTNKKVVFLVRDPRDVLVSSWYHLRYRERIYKKDLASFIRDHLVGIDKVVAFMNMWLANSSVPNDFFLLTYEEMHADPVASFRRILEFMGTKVELKALQLAVEESSFQKMRQMELEAKEPWLKPGFKSLSESMKIRRGKVGTFREELSSQDIEFLDFVIKNKLSSKLPYR